MELTTIILIFLFIAAIYLSAIIAFVAILIKLGTIAGDFKKWINKEGLKIIIPLAILLAFIVGCITVYVVFVYLIPWLTSLGVK